MKLRPCARQRCGAIVRAPARYCEPHALEEAARLADDRDRREPWRYLYGLKVWREAREAARRQAGYACESCGRGEELAARALDVHHVRPLAELWRLAGGGTPAFDQPAFEYAATDEASLRVLCDPCHAQEELDR